MGISAEKMQEDRAPEAGEEEASNRRENVNGIEIEFLWNSDLGRYAISFPQIEPDSEALEEAHVQGQRILLSERSEIAKEVFDFAVQIARTIPDAKAEDVWREVWNYCKEFPRAGHKKLAA